MQNGELQGRIDLDTLSNRKGLFGLGPKAFLSGEILVLDGKSYVSGIEVDSNIVVDETYDVSAPFFVFANVTDWVKAELPTEVRTMTDLEEFLGRYRSEQEAAFVFQLSGSIKQADFHIQNLAEGSTVSSPEDAHQGQVNYSLKDEKVEIVGFFSKKHQGIFTHHDSYLHMHMITQDRTQMGHLDALEIGKMQLHLPKE